MDEDVTDGGLRLVTGEARPGGARPGALARDILIATTSAAVVRGLIWLFSLFVIGPVGGTATFGLSGTSLGNTAPVVTEAVLSALALAAAIKIAIEVRRDELRWRPRVRAFCWIYVADTVFYIGSILIALYVWGGWSDADQYIWVLIVIGVNLPLLCLGLWVAHRAR